MFEGWAAAAVGAAVVGSVVSSSAAKSAAGKQARAAGQAADASLEATQETNALQYQLYQQQLVNNSPGAQIQQEAQSALASGLGLGTPTTGMNQLYNQPVQRTGTIEDGSGGQTGYPSVNGGYYPMSITGGITNGPSAMSLAQPATSTTGSSGTGIPMGYPGSNNIPGGTPNGMSMGGGFQASADNAGLTQPPTTDIPGIGKVGLVNAGATQAQLNAGGASQARGSLLANFSNKDLQSQLNPSYNFILNQGLTSTANYDAAHGISGGQAMRDQSTFAQNTASTYYQQAFNNYRTQQQANIDNLSTLAGNGASGASNSAAAGAASGISQNTQNGVNAANEFRIGGANASAAGQVGSANAISGALGSAGNVAFQSYLANKIYG